jgi:hypothetical protein
MTALRVSVAAIIICTPAMASRMHFQLQQSLKRQGQANSNTCGEILKDGIRNQLTYDLSAHDKYEAQEMLKQFDENYSYDDYKRDTKNAEASSSSESSHSSTSVSVSYGLFSVGGSHSNGRSNSNSMMTQAEFNARKKRIMQQKKALETSSSSTTDSSKDLSFAAQTVSPEVANAWQACVRFAQSQIETSVNAEVTGQNLQIGLKHTLGSGPEPKIPPLLVLVQVVPQGAATCTIVDGNGEVKDEMPVPFHIGIPIHISCHRSDGNTGKISVYVASNVVKDGLRAFFTDVVTPSVAQDLEKLKKDMGMRFKIEDRKISEAKGSIESQKRDVISNFTSVSKNFTNIDRRISEAVSSLSSSIDTVDSKISLIRAKINRGVCRLCYTCGGDFGNHEGSYPKGEHTEYGSGCANPAKGETDNPYLCCMSKA